ncbi:MAG: hypothetical protein J6Y20_08965 [Lachnospiraceae bacterium]|nr:hypothetical protein [Lachnospiraceae bacterium]
MAFETFDYTRKWTDPNPTTGFKTYEDREDVVRADLQQLWDEVRDFINEKLVAKLNNRDFEVSVGAGDVTFTPTAYISATDVQAAIEYVMSQIAESWEGTISDNTITGAKMVEGAIDTRELADDAVTEDKLHDDSVDYFHIKTNAVRRDAIKDGEVTNDKLAPGVLPNKADLVDGIVNPAQLRLRRINRQISGSTYQIGLADISAYLILSSFDVFGGVTIELPYSSTIPVGSYVFLNCHKYVTAIAPGNGVTLYVCGGDGLGVGSFEIHSSDELCLAVKLSLSEWMLVPFPGIKKIATNDLNDWAVTHDKLAEDAVHTGNIKNGEVTYEKTSGVQKKVDVVQQYDTGYVTVPRSGWYNNRQTVSAVDGVTKNSKLVLEAWTDVNYPGTSSTNNWLRIRDYGVRCVGHDNGKLTFECESVPDSDVWFSGLAFN